MAEMTSNEMMLTIGGTSTPTGRLYLGTEVGVFQGDERTTYIMIGSPPPAN
jgi:hypothetical protein